MRVSCPLTCGCRIDRLAARAFRLASARKGRATDSGVLRRGYLCKCERTGVRLCMGVA